MSDSGIESISLHGNHRWVLVHVNLEIQQDFAGFVEQEKGAVTPFFLHYYSWAEDWGLPPCRARHSPPSLTSRSEGRAGSRPRHTGAVSKTCLFCLRFPLEPGSGEWLYWPEL